MILFILYLLSSCISKNAKGGSKCTGSSCKYEPKKTTKKKVKISRELTA